MKNFLGSVQPEEATHVVVGITPEGHGKVISWHNDLWLAKRASHENNRLGGKSKVTEAPKGDWTLLDRLHKTFEELGCFS